MNVSWRLIALVGLVSGAAVQPFTYRETFAFAVVLTLAVGFGHLVKYLVGGDYFEGKDM